MAAATLTGRLVPYRVEEVSLAGAVVSMVVVDPDPSHVNSVDAIWNTFCHHSFFFPSRAEAQQWAAGRENIEIVPVEEGFAIGRQLASRMLTDGS